MTTPALPPGRGEPPDVRIEDGQRVLYTSTRYRLPGGAIVCTQQRQPVTSLLDDLMQQLGITDDDLPTLITPEDDQ